MFLVVQSGRGVDLTSRLPVKDGRGAEGRVATGGGIMKTPIMSAKKFC